MNAMQARTITWGARTGLTLLMGLVAGCPAAGPGGPAGSTLVYGDDFSAATLDAGWTFAGLDPNKWSLSSRTGFLRIFPEPLAANPDDTQDSLMLRPESGDFILETYMDFQTLEDRQVAGLVIEGDDGRQVTLVLTSASAAVGTFRGLFMAADRGPDVPQGRANASFAGTGVYLRLQRSGSSYIGSFSADGTNYTPVGTLSDNLSDSVMVGVGTAKGRSCATNCMQSVYADFDFFEIWSASAP